MRHAYMEESLNVLILKLWSILSSLNGLLMCLIWFLLQPITLALVYVGTTLKDLSDVTHGWSEFSKTRWVRDLTFFFFFSLLLLPPFSPNLGMLSLYPAQHMATETRTIAHLLPTGNSQRYICSWRAWKVLESRF